MEFHRRNQFTIPIGTIVPPDGYLVIAKNRRAVADKYPV